MFVKKLHVLVQIMKAKYEENAYLKHIHDALLLLPKLMTFWKQIKIYSYSSYLDKINGCKTNIDLFYHHSLYCMFITSIVGDGKTFYAHVSKHYVPRMSKCTLNYLGCGVSIWTM